MRAVCVVLVLMMLLSSTLAKPWAYEHRDKQSGINKNYLQYVRRPLGNGMM